MSVTVNYCSVEERDMDTLFLEAIGSDNDFLKLFLNKIDSLKECNNVEVIDIQLSKSDFDGESDITVIVKASGKKYGLLIEDKINAKGMEKQCDRYFKRGDKGKKNKDYEDYFVFIVAPQKYYDQDEEAKKYPNYVSYEDCKNYLETKTDSISRIWVQQIEQALEKSKHSSTTNFNEDRNNFFRKYREYQEANYPNLTCVTNPESSGTGCWVHFTSKPKISYIMHKAPAGTVDLTFNKTEKKEPQFKYLEEKVHQLGFKNVRSVKTGKSMSFQIKVPVIDFDQPFEKCNLTDLNKCLEACEQLAELADIIGYFSEITIEDDK